MVRKTVFKATNIMLVGSNFFYKKRLILDEEKLWEEYTQGKQTYVQLAEKYACSAKKLEVI